MFRFVLALAAAASLFASSAHAADPYPQNCTVDHVIISSWNEQGAPSGIGPCAGTPGFDVVVRDINNAPVPNATIKIQFTLTGTAIKPYRSQSGQVFVQCNDRSINVVTDANGHATIVPHFGRWTESPVVPVYANGFLLQYVEARSPDYNCNGSVELADLVEFVNDLKDTSTPHPRSDFDDCPGVTLGDFSFFAAQLLASQAGSPAPVCP
jgi:hypothetical protein